MIGQLYFYRLLLKNGKKKSGIARFVVARDFSVLLWLERRHRAVVLSLHRLPVWLGHFLFAFGKLFLPSIGADELSGLLRDLGLMLKSGIPLIDGLATIKDETRFGESGGAVMAAGILHSELEGGATVSQAFSRHPDLFPEIVCHLVEIGNESGTLDRMLLEASGHLDRMALIGRNVRQALIYPVFVFAVIIGAAAFWIYYVIPNLSELFRQLHAKMPPLTLAVMRFTDWLAAHGVLSLLILLILVLTPWLCFRYSEKVRRSFYHLGHRLPISGLLLRVSGMAFLAEHLGLLVRAGLNIVQSLQILERATSDE
ncbi:MAG: type II secretion system F family protein, partial [Candidatus Accumulibacter sp.]|nr:type II secretion system F family protein [Accumulibacter sp.]